MREAATLAVSATDWIRIFASRLALRRPNLCAERVLADAIDHFHRCHSLAPELAAEQFGDLETEVRQS